MKLAVWANTYDCPYFGEWRRAMDNQDDSGFTILYSALESANTVLRHACSVYGAILFLDIDDIPEPSLVSQAKASAEKHDITAFGMTLVDEKNERELGTFGKMVDISKHNVWGFGNTVYRSEVLAHLLPIPEEYPPDWNLAKRAHDMGCTLHFEPLPLIRYRQYGQNKRLQWVNGIHVWGSEPE